ncbi:hypothetical protein D3C78_1215780 [compost metagenome]
MGNRSCVSGGVIRHVSCAKPFGTACGIAEGHYTLLSFDAGSFVRGEPDAIDVAGSRSGSAISAATGRIGDVRRTAAVYPMGEAVDQPGDYRRGARCGAV